MTTKGIRPGSIAESLFTSRARLAVLGLLLVHSGERFYLREIAARTGLPVRAVQRELARLHSGGLLSVAQEGRRKYYQANRLAPVYPELRALLLKTVALGDSLKRDLMSAAGQITAAFLFGSFARGDESAGSDVDLFVIGSTTSRELAKALRPAREALGREINPALLTEVEFRRRLAQGDHFVHTILADPMMFLIGGPDDLERLVGPGPSTAASHQPKRNRRSPAPRRARR